MTFREMIRKTDTKDVFIEWNKLVSYDLTFKIIGYLREELLNFEEQENPQGKIVLTKLFSSSVIDVSYRENGQDYAIDLMDRREFIDCEIEVNRIQLSNEKILAVIFDEITFYGLQNRQILDKRKELEEKAFNALEELKTL